MRNGENGEPITYLFFVSAASITATKQSQTLSFYFLSNQFKMINVGNTVTDLTSLSSWIGLNTTYGIIQLSLTPKVTVQNILEHGSQNKLGIAYM